MRRFLFSMIALFFVIYSKAQTPYIDVLTAPAMVTYAEAIKGQQNKTNNNLSAIERGQVAVMGQLQVANDLHDKVLRGLTQVSGTLSNALTVREIYSTSQDIVTNTQEAIRIASGNPLLTVFAVKSANEFKRRALNMSAEVARILTGGESNMMDAGERQKLLNYIHSEIRLLGAVAFAVKFNMEYAKMVGIWNSLNPFRRWVNQDVQIMNDIISKSKMI